MRSGKTPMILRGKYFVIAISVLANLGASAQAIDTAFFQTYGRSRLYYVKFDSTVATVYELGRYFDNAGTGYSLTSNTNLVRRSEASYVGDDKSIARQHGKFYLLAGRKGTKKYQIGPVQRIESANRNLNNAYYLGEYFKMSDELNKMFPLNHHSFRNGFYSWDNLTNKEVDHSRFREFAHKRILYIKDSISRSQNKYVARTKYLVDNIHSIDYNTLKDSLIHLPPEYKGMSWYYGTVVSVVAKQRPEFFFRLAEDLPNNQGLIFLSVDDDKEVIQSLKGVEGYYEVKEIFFKERRFNKTFGYRILGAYAIIGGLVTWLIVSQ